MIFPAPSPDVLRIRELLARLDENARKAAIASLSAEHASTLAGCWDLLAHPHQRIPPGPWSEWWVMGGRGIGKTRVGSETTRKVAEHHLTDRIAIIGPTIRAARQVMVEGPSGILAVSSPKMMPEWRKADGELIWPNGVVGYVFTAEEPERLRGPAYGFVWGDEPGAWRRIAAVMDQILFGAREGTSPKIIYTTTPRRRPEITNAYKRWQRGDTRYAFTHSSTFGPNAVNLAADALRRMDEKYSGTRLGRQELKGELLMDIAGTLWPPTLLELARVEPEEVPDLKRVVVSIDPAVTDGKKSADTGIVVVGIGPPPLGSGRPQSESHGYLLEDLSQHAKPDAWTAAAVAAYRRWKADAIVAEVNNGGDLVESLLRVVDSTVSYKPVRATRGKTVRAEPVAALYEQGRMHHVRMAQTPIAEIADGRFGLAKLEDQLQRFTDTGIVAGEDDEDDRVDRAEAHIWGATHLFSLSETKQDLGMARARLGRW